MTVEQTEAMYQMFKSRMETEYILIKRVKESELAIDRMSMINLVLSETCGYYNLTLEQIKKRTRTHPYPLAKQVFYYLCRKSMGNGVGVKFLADQLNQDHCSCIHGVKTIKNLLDVDPQIKGEVAEIERRINEKLNIAKNEPTTNTVAN